MEEKRLKKLIIAPHADDEVLGCGGILDDDSFVYFCGMDESKVSIVELDSAHRISLEERKKEIQKVSEFLGFKYKINIDTKVNHYNDSKADLINIFEKLINQLKPEMIFIPIPSYNQDHQIIYESLQVALRPHDKNFFVKKILLYEQVHSIIWEHKNYAPNYFVPIDIERKLESYALHKSQVRQFRSPETIRAIAKLRGAMSNLEYAEAFVIQRWIE